MVTASLDGGGRLRGHSRPPRSAAGRRHGDRHLRPAGLGAETALVIVEIYRRGGAWKVRAVGQGYANGLAGHRHRLRGERRGARRRRPPHPYRRPPARAATAGLRRRRPARPPPTCRRRPPAPPAAAGAAPRPPARSTWTRAGSTCSKNETVSLVKARPAAAVQGQDGPGLGARVRRQGHRPGRLGHRLRPAARPHRHLLLRQAEHPQRRDPALRRQPDGRGRRATTR